MTWSNKTPLLSTTVILLGSMLAPGCTDPHIRVVQNFRAAMKRDDFEKARSYLADDARIWFENRAGEGRPWKPSGGTWSSWDKFFRGSTEPIGPYHVRPDTNGVSVWILGVETNDFYKLTERSEARMLLTWYFDSSGKLSGFQVARVGNTVDRRGEFQAWAKEHEPAELDYLMPGGDIDPSGDRPARFKAILERWRSAAGLPPIHGR